MRLKLRRLPILLVGALPLAAGFVMFSFFALFDWLSSCVDRTERTAAAARRRWRWEAIRKAANNNKESNT